MVIENGEIKIDAETLSKQDGLSESQAEAIALDAIKEIEAGKKKTPEELAAAAAEQGKESEEDASGKKTVPTAEELAAKEQEEKIKEEERILALKEEELSEEDKPKKAEIVKARSEVKTKALQEEVSAYAKEHNVTEEEAREDLESIAKIQDKYKGDPKQLAKANLHMQRLYTKAEADAKALKDAKPSRSVPEEIPIEMIKKGLTEGKINYQGKPLTREMIIEKTRKDDPELTDSMDDDKVFELGAREFKKHVDKGLAEQRGQFAIQAKEKRATVIDTIPEADKKYAPDVKPMIEGLPDTQIMDDSFDIGIYITYAKGKTFEATVKQLEDDKKTHGEKEYKRGLEEAKILGVKRPPNGGPPKSGGSGTLTDEQKQRAKEMFDNPDITEDQAFKLYSDYLKERKQ